MKTDEIDALKLFINELIIKLFYLGAHDVADKLKAWDNSKFTSAPEFLGELRIILRRIVTLNKLDEQTRQTVVNLIDMIETVSSKQIKESL